MIEKRDRITEQNLDILLGGGLRFGPRQHNSEGSEISSIALGLEYIPDKFTNRPKLSIEDLAKIYPIIVAAAYFFPKMAESIIFGRNP